MSNSFLTVPCPSKPIEHVSVELYAHAADGTPFVMFLGAARVHLSIEHAALLAQQLTDRIAEAAEGVNH